MRYYYRIIKLFLLIVFAGSIIGPSPAFAGHITASGCSVSNVGYLSELAKEYEKKTGEKVFVRGGGSLLGLHELTIGKVDFAASCRGRAADDPEDIEFIQVAWDALVFIVHKSNKLENITPAEVRAIYSGKIVNWKELGGSNVPIKVFVSKPVKGLSGVESSTKELVLQGKDSVRTENSHALASTGIVEQMIEKTPDAFATTGFSSARKRNVKILRVNGIYPTKDNIAKDRYSYRRPLFLLVQKKSTPAVRSFIDFALSKDGQKFISSQGVLSLTDIK